MTTAREYRQYANECPAWAKMAKNDKDREAFLDVAKAWLQVAALEDGAPPIPNWEPPVNEGGPKSQRGSSP